MEEIEVGENDEVVESPVQGSLWKVLAKLGDVVEEGEVLAIAEAMKMEVDIEAPSMERSLRYFAARVRISSR